MFKPNLSMEVDRARRQTRMLDALSQYTEEKKTVSEIAAYFDCSRTTIQRWVRLAGVKKRNEIAAARISDILKDYQQTNPVLPIKTIALKYNVSQSFVSQQASKAGIARRKFK